MSNLKKHTCKSNKVKLTFSQQKRKTKIWIIYMPPLQMTFLWALTQCIMCVELRWRVGMCMGGGEGGRSSFHSFLHILFWCHFASGNKTVHEDESWKNCFLHLAVTHFAMPASFHPKATFCIILWWYTYSIFEQLTFAVIQQRAILRQNGLIVATFILSSFWYRNKLSTAQVNMVTALYIRISNSKQRYRFVSKSH